MKVWMIRDQGMQMECGGDPHEICATKEIAETIAAKMNDYLTMYIVEEWEVVERIDQSSYASG